MIEHQQVIADRVVGVDVAAREQARRDRGSPSPPGRTRGSAASAPGGLRRRSAPAAPRASRAGRASATAGASRARPRPASRHRPAARKSGPACRRRQVRSKAFEQTARRGEDVAAGHGMAGPFRANAAVERKRSANQHAVARSRSYTTGAIPNYDNVGTVRSGRKRSRCDLAAIESPRAGARGRAA